MKSRVQKKEMRWEKLDNTANLFPVIANETMTNVYRIAVILSKDKMCIRDRYMGI